MRPCVFGPRAHHLTRRIDGLLRPSAQKQRGCAVVARFQAVRKPGDHRVRERREPFAVAGVGEDRRQLLGGARLVGRQAQGVRRRLHRPLDVAGDREHAGELDPHHRIARIAAGDRAQPFAFLVELACAAGRVGQTRQRGGVPAVQRHRLPERGVRVGERLSLQVHQAPRRPGGIGRSLEDVAHHRRPFGCQRADRRRVVLTAPAVDAARCRVLERRPVVGLDERVGAVALQLTRTAGKLRQQRERRGALRDPDVNERCADRACPAAGFDGRQSRDDVAVSRADQQQVASAHHPQRALRKHRSERPDDRLQILRADVVGVRPLAEQAVRFQARARGLEELPREERRDAGHPRIRRLRHDDVVALRRQQQMRSPVADDQPDARLREGAAVLAVEEVRRLDHFR